MEKLITFGIGTVTVLVFGPVLIGAFTNAVWPGFVNLLAYIFWFFVAIIAAVVLFVLVRKLLAMNAQERAQQEQEAGLQANKRSQRAELEALHTQVRNAYDNIFDAEQRRAPPRISQ